MKEYWTGNKNKFIRYYFYVQKGLALLNEARYLVMAIFALYVVLKFDNILFLPLMFLASLPLLIFLGWLYVHHMAKVMEYLSVKYSTHWSKYGYELQEKRNKTLKLILKLLWKGRKK